MIVAAAIRTSDGRVWTLPRPARHHDIIRLIADRTKAKRVFAPCEDQGFLACSICQPDRGHDKALAWFCPAGSAAHGFFMRRSVAEHHARECGQLTGDLIGSILTSEDLW